MACISKNPIEYCAVLALRYSNLMSLQIGGGFAGFMGAWDTCLQALSLTPDEHLLRALLEMQLRKRSALRPLCANIEGSSLGSHKKTYTYLYESAHREINRRQKGSPSSPAAAAAKAAKAKYGAQKPQSRQRSSPPAEVSTAAMDSPTKEAWRNFAIGKCKYGESCRFSHGGLPPRPRPKPKLRPMVAELKDRSRRNR